MTGCARQNMHDRKPNVSYQNDLTSPDVEMSKVR